MSVVSKLKDWSTSTSSSRNVVYGVGAFVFVELYKEQIFQYSWVVGIVAMLLTLVLLYYYQYSWDSASFAVQVAFAYVSSLALIFVALFGWWVCNNKKDTLNMKRTLASIMKTLTQWSDAQKELEGAMAGIEINDRKISDIQKEIRVLLEQLQKQLDTVIVDQKKHVTDKFRDTIVKFVANCNRVANDALRDADEKPVRGTDKISGLGVHAFRAMLLHMLKPNQTPRFLYKLSVFGKQAFLDDLQKHEGDAKNVLGQDINDFLKAQAANAEVNVGYLVGNLVQRDVGLLIMLGGLDALASYREHDEDARTIAHTVLSNNNEARRLLAERFQRFTSSSTVSFNPLNEPLIQPM